MIEICSAIGFKSTHSTWNVKELIWEWQVRCISLGVEVNVKLQSRHTKNWDKLNISSLSQTTPQKKKSKKKLLKIVPVLREKKYGKLIFIVSSRFETKLSNQNSQNPYTHTYNFSCGIHHMRPEVIHPSASIWTLKIDFSTYREYAPCFAGVDCYNLLSLWPDYIVYITMNKAHHRSIIFYSHWLVFGGYTVVLPKISSLRHLETTETTNHNNRIEVFQNLANQSESTYISHHLLSLESIRFLFWYTIYFAYLFF